VVADILFDGPSTTSIHTPSLHDALPIYRKKPLGLIAIRGSVATQVSFLANLYAAMIPAAGEIQLDHDFLFRYQLAEHPQAAVQVDRKSTRLNSSHVKISYAVFCLKKKK